MSPARRAALPPGPVLVTGATGGVGVPLVLQLAKRGHHLVLSGRDRARLDQLSEQVRERGGSAVVRPADLRDATQVQQLVEQVLAADGVPAAVISLAGHSIHRPLVVSLDRPHDLERLTGTNLLGPARLILGLLGPMGERGSGVVIAVTSATARIPNPGWAAYGASKAGLDAWLRAIRPEAARTGVRIAIIELPLVATAMAAPTYGSAPRGALSPEQAAARVLRALDRPLTLVSPAWARTGAVLSQAAPALAAHTTGIAGAWVTRLSRREVRR